MAERVMLDRDALITALKFLDAIVPSLDRIGSSASMMSEEEYKQVLSDFVHDWDVGRKLAEVRKTLAGAFGDDELEHLFEGIETWELNHRKPRIG